MRRCSPTEGGARFADVTGHGGAAARCRLAAKALRPPPPPPPPPPHDSSPAAIIAPRYPCGPPLSLSDSEMGLLRNFVQCDMTLFRAAAAAAQTQMGWPHAKGICTREGR